MILSALNFAGKTKNPVLYETKNKGPPAQTTFSVELSQFLRHRRLRHHSRRRLRLRFACDTVTST
jgi:hypothetical protein